jgi:hypothetical protein
VDRPEGRRGAGSRLPLDGDELGAVADSLFSEGVPAAPPRPPAAGAPPHPPAAGAPAAGAAGAPPVGAASAPPVGAEPAGSERAAAPSSGARRFAPPGAGARERGSDWLILSGAALLLVSLFLTWSHQLSGSLRHALAGTAALQGVVADPDAWQVYTVAGVLLAWLALVLGTLALRGSRRARLLSGPPVMLALAFVAHALGHPPTDGTNLVAGALSPVRYVPNHVSSGAGELVALVGLAAALLGIALTPPESLL